MYDNNVKYQLSKMLFWDVDIETIDMSEHKAWIVARVLDYGEINDWRLIRDYYGLAQIGEIAQTLRSLTPKALSFIAAMSHTPIEQFRCYKHSQSNNQHWSS